MNSSETPKLAHSTCLHDRLDDSRRALEYQFRRLLHRAGYDHLNDAAFKCKHDSRILQLWFVAHRDLALKACDRLAGSIYFSDERQVNLAVGPDLLRLVNSGAPANTNLITSPDKSGLTWCSRLFGQRAAHWIFAAFEQHGC